MSADLGVDFDNDNLRIRRKSAGDCWADNRVHKRDKPANVRSIASVVTAQARKRTEDEPNNLTLAFVARPLEE